MTRPTRRLRQALPLLVALAAATAPAAHARTAAADPDADAPPPVAATVASCLTGPAATDRSVVFEGTMPAIGRAVGMGMRFELFERRGDDDAFTRVRLPAFSAWVRSERDVAGFVYDKRVERLAAPAAYRVEVAFRWYDAKGRVVRRARRTSPLCRQPELRPDLRITRLVVGPARPDATALYSVTVANAGRGAVLVPFATGLSVAGVALAPQTTPVLDAGASATLTFVGPPCRPGAAALAIVDPDGAVDEADELANTERRACPT